MSRKIIHASARSLPVAAAALLIHIGAAAAATPPSDFQRQVGAVLAGNVATHSSLHASPTRERTGGLQTDAQQFARELLSGWSVSHPGRTGSATQSGSRTAADVRRESPAQEDMQSMVQRFLLGEKSAARSAS